MKHDDVWHALPFYVNGTLRGQARADVETHLASCAECRAELSTQTQVRDTILHEEVRQETAQASFEQLWDRILEDETVADAHATPRSTPIVPPVARRSPKSHTLKWLVAAVIIEGIGLATLSAMTWSQSLSVSPDYRTLSSPDTPLPGGQIRAVFSPDLRLAEPPFPFPHFAVKMYWHRTSQSDAALRWLRASLVDLFAGTARWHLEA